MTNCHYQDYYVNQAGTGVGSIYKGSVYQKGRGFGSFFKGLFRTIMPLIKSGVKTIGKEALRSGSYFLNDVVNDVPVKDAFKLRVNESVENLKRKAENKIDDMTGSGGVIKRRRSKNKNQKSNLQRGVHKSRTQTNKVKSSDIFD